MELKHAKAQWYLPAVVGWWLVPVIALAVGDHFDIAEIDDTPRIRDIEYPDWFKESFLDLRDDLQESLQSGKTGLMVYFGQKHCAYCEALMEVNFGREEDIVRYTQANFDVVPIDIWGAREVTDMGGEVLAESDYAEREGTNFTPSIIFYDRAGEEALRLRGYYPPYKFRAALEYVVDGYYKQESLRSYLTRADPPPKFDVGEMISEPYFERPPYALDRTRIPGQKPLVVFFEQRECHACDILHTEPLADPQTRQLLQGFNVVQLDMWSDTPVVTPQGKRTTASEWAHDLGLFYAPALVFFDQGGTEVFRLDSVARIYRLRGALQYVLEEGYKGYPTFQRWREAQPAGEMDRGPV